MNIQNISFSGNTENNITNGQIEKIKKKFFDFRCKRKFPELKSDVLDLSTEAKIKLQADKIFSRSKKFSIEDYNSLTNLEKNILRVGSFSVKRKVDDTLTVGLKVKNNLDRHYGKDKYVFCCIGTSTSGIGRVLEFTGVETKYLPISGLKWYVNYDCLETILDKFENYKKFLEEQGLTKEKVSNSDKEYLFCDYVFSGKTLELFSEMIKKYFSLNLQNVSFHSANFLCYSSCEEKYGTPRYAKNYVKDYMGFNDIADVGGIPHLYVDEIEKIEECKQYENIEAKKFNFLLIDALYQKGLLKYNPENKNSL